MLAPFDFRGTMPKKKRATAKRAATPADPKARSKEEIQRVQNKVTNVILDHSVDMATRVVQSVAEGGQITALKFLWQTAGLFPSGKPVEEDDSPDMLAKILLGKLGMDDDPPKKTETEAADVESDEEDEEGNFEAH